MISSAIIDKLSNILSSIHEQAKAIDQQNSHEKAFQLRKDNAIFSEALFSCNSEYLVPYVNETQLKLKELTKLLAENKRQFSYDRLQLIEHQISALINTIKSNQILNKSSIKQYEINKQRKYRLAAKSLFEPIQSLHQKLAETFEFERRLQAMLDEKQRQLATANPNNSKVISEQLLVLHQRLGRCRQAISKLERQIELKEKR